jgi:hypothetical protein
MIISHKFLATTLTFWLFSSFGFGQDKNVLPLEKEFHLSEATLVAKDVKLSATWYRKYLNIQIKAYKPKELVTMRIGDFTLYIKQSNSILLKSRLKLPEGKKYINGITKIGFSCNRFDSLYKVLIEQKQKIIEPISKDKNLDLRFFLTQDPDGNQIQIFDIKENEPNFNCRANFFAITSSDFINTMNWYEKNIDFTEIAITDNSKIHFQNLLHKGKVIFEIIHLPYESLETTFPLKNCNYGHTSINKFTTIIVLIFN